MSFCELFEASDQGVIDRCRGDFPDKTPPVRSAASGSVSPDDPMPNHQPNPDPSAVITNKTIIKALSIRLFVYLYDVVSEVKQTSKNLNVMGRKREGIEPPKP